MGDTVDGIMVTFWHYMRMSDGRIEKSRDQMAFPGTVEQFKKANPNTAVVGYHEIVDGVVTETCTMLNEKLPDLQKPNEAISGAITPEMVQKAVEKANVQEKPQKNTTNGVSAQNVQQHFDDKVYKDGDSYIKISGGKVFKLKWSEYDDSKAEFDKKIKYVDGKIMVTKWEELQS